MVNIKSSGDIDKNYRASIGRVPTNYKDGIMRTTDWAEKAGSDAAENLWKEQIDQAAAARRRQKAIQAVSNEEWKNRAADLGAKRIGTGMTANADKRTRNYEPYRETIAGISLPDRTASGRENVINRVIPIVEALEEKKKQIKG